MGCAGFLFTGELRHPHLTTTQYIAPLIANFDTRLGNSSIIRYFVNSTYTCPLYMSTVHTHVLYTCQQYIHLFYIHVNNMYTCSVYIHVNSTYTCSIYMSTICTPVLCICQQYVHLFCVHVNSRPTYSCSLYVSTVRTSVICSCQTVRNLFSIHFKHVHLNVKHQEQIRWCRDI